MALVSRISILIESRSQEIWIQSVSDFAFCAPPVPRNAIYLYCQDIHTHSNWKEDKHCIGGLGLSTFDFN